MQKKAGLIIGAIVVIVVLVAFFLMQKSNPSTSSQTADTMQNQTNDDTAASMTKGSIASLLTAGKNVTCSMTYPDGKGSGTIYVSGKKMRGDFTMMDASREYKSSMIQDGEYAYMWSDADKKGTKFKVAGIPSPSPVANAKMDTADINQEVDLNCSTWGVDPSRFVVPTDVEFTDMSSMMEQMQDQSGMMKDADKSACDAISDPQAKAACQSALGN